jgi:CRP-like cAMP-binding protein
MEHNAQPISCPFCGQPTFRRAAGPGIAPAVVAQSPITIQDAARSLGVTREHLSRVIHGHRESRSLRDRYAALVVHHQTL